MNEEELRNFKLDDLSDFKIFWEATERTANLIKKQQKEIKKSKRENKNGRRKLYYRKKA